MIDLVPLLVVGAGVLQLPLIMDAISHCFPHSRVGRAVTSTMRLILLACMMASVTLAIYMQLVILLPEQLRTRKENALGHAIDEAENTSWPAILVATPQGLMHTVFSLWLYVQLSCYFFAACSEPASRIKPPKAGAVAPIQPPPGAKRWCKECGVEKLLRTHHCRVCRCCVELMDHHCPFTGNCVGLTNFRSFYLWLCFGLVGVAYASWCSWQPFRDCVWAGIPHAGDVEAGIAGPGAAGVDLSTLSGAAATKALARAARIAAWRSLHGDSCDRLGDAAWLWLLAFMGFLSTLCVWAAQTALMFADQTTVEWLAGAAQLKVGLRAPEDVRADAEERKRIEATRNAAGNGGSVRRQQVSNGNGAAAANEEELALTHATDVESGTPASEATLPAYPSHAAAYNPHKSFRKLVMQGLPWWTLFVPPQLLNRGKLQRMRDTAHSSD